MQNVKHFITRISLQFSFRVFGTDCMPHYFLRRFLYTRIPTATAPAAPAAATPATTDQVQTGTLQPAASAAPADEPRQEGSLFDMLLPLILLAVIFYFLIVRPSRKQQKEMQERQNSLKEGDKVITAGGLYGIIRTVKQDSVLLEVATNVVIKVDKRSIAANVSKSGTPENQK